LSTRFAIAITNRPAHSQGTCKEHIIEPDGGKWDFVFTLSGEKTVVMLRRFLKIHSVEQGKFTHVNNNAASMELLAFDYGQGQRRCQY
jgi:hypothetical protein